MDSSRYFDTSAHGRVLLDLTHQIAPLRISDSADRTAGGWLAVAAGGILTHGMEFTVDRADSVI